jgi:hypothetical protein
VALFSLLLFFCFGAYHVYAYRVGTPTTATNVQCTEYRHGQDCAGTWSVGGKSYTGPIIGASGNASSLDVRVHDGNAYTANAGRWDFILGTIMTVTLAAVVAFARWRGRRRTGPVVGR